ncbi:MAG: ankyrin repeat domain-containing protein [Marinifilaceae bacterium]|jgi:ankyrin repeat protein|nr:ankyrin repeat domain-containing protein [Marinifilaceae bacterium]
MKKTNKLIWMIIAFVIISINTNAQSYDKKAKEENSPNDVYAFIYNWFSGFDHQKDLNYFTKFIAKPVNMEFPGQPIKSISDFADWYKWIQENIEWNSHALTNVQISGNDTQGWIASYNVLWKAKDIKEKNIILNVHQELEIKRIKDQLKITKHRVYERGNNHQDTHMTALMKAAGVGNIEKVKSLIKSGANIFELDPITGSSVVHFAAQGGNVAVMKVLIENGAESIINLQAASNSFTPLMWATWYQNTEMIKYLLSLKHINANLTDQFGRRADQFPAIAKGYKDYHPIDKEIISIYKNYYAKYSAYVQNKFEDDRIRPKNLAKDVNLQIPNNEIGAGQHTAALVAARDNKINLFKELIKNGAIMTAEGEYMKAIVAHKAAYMGNPEIMKLIVKHADFNKIKNAQGPTNGYTPLHDAIWHGHTETARILIDAGVNTKLKAWDGMTPLDLAKKLKYKKIIKMMQNVK